MCLTFRRYKLNILCAFEFKIVSIKYYLKMIDMQVRFCEGIMGSPLYFITIKIQLYTRKIR